LYNIPNDLNIGSACEVMIFSERLPAQKGFHPSIITELQHYLNINTIILMR